MRLLGSALGAAAAMTLWFSASCLAQQAPPMVRVAPPPHTHTGKGVLRANSCPKLTYPEASLREQVAGTGRAKVEINAEAKYLNSYIAVSSGSAELDRAALAALSTCQYTPSFYQGVGIKDSLTVEFTWSLEPTPSVSFDSK